MRAADGAFFDVNCLVRVDRADPVVQDCAAEQRFKSHHKISLSAYFAAQQERRPLDQTVPAVPLRYPLNSAGVASQFKVHKLP